MDNIPVEVVLKNKLSPSNHTLITVCDQYLNQNKLRPGTVISKFNSKDNLYLYDCVDHIIIGENANLKNNFIDFSQVQIEWFLYTLDKNGPQVESVCDAEGENLQLATTSALPSSQYFNLWENLIYDSNIKENLLDYAATAMLFADRGVDCNVISCNRVVLLHGPPGTGKTSLCRALAHKLTIRMKKRFKHGFLLEVNSHSLFSKWFSESGKLVTKMFDKIYEYLEDPNLIIFVLIDEVESLTRAREQTMSGVEPSDAIRVVNAILTQLDRIKNYSNALILTTSNMTGAIDLAFIDRADITQFIGLPGPEAIFHILHSCIEELFKANIIQPRVIIPPMSWCFMSQSMNNEDQNIFPFSSKLYKISTLCVGCSGRTLRKIPFLAHSLFLKKIPIDLDEFLNAVTRTIKHLAEDKAHFSNHAEM